MSKVLIHKIVRSKRKTISLIISPDATLTVKAPFLAEESMIESIVSRKRNWIIRKQKEVLLRPAQKLKNLFNTKRELEEVNTRAAYYAKNAGLHFKKITLSNARTRWGSCGPDGRIRISRLLLRAPLEVLDYVLAHEIAHLKIRNHSARFWALVEEIFPGYSKHRKWLKDFGYQLQK